VNYFLSHSGKIGFPKSYLIRVADGMNKFVQNLSSLWMPCIPFYLQTIAQKAAERQNPRQGFGVAYLWSQFSALSFLKFSWFDPINFDQGSVS